ncbi:MAG: hypothetical protein AAFX85_12205, partial [Pseudomonadota bacterium]
QNRNASDEDDLVYPKFYSAGTVNVGTSASAGGEFVLGYWRSPYNNLRGRSHGASADLISMMGAVGALAGKELPKKLNSVSFVITLWWERVDEDGDGKEQEWGEYQGFTIGIGGGVSAPIPNPEFEYLQAKTNQVCDYGMGCAIHQWREVHPSSFWGSGDNGVSLYETEVAGGLSIDVLERTDDLLRVNFTDSRGTVEKRFERDTKLDDRDYKRVENGVVTERLCYRSSNAKLMYRPADRNCDGGVRLVRDKFRPGGVVVNVKSRTKEKLVVDITRAGETRVDVEFEEATSTDKRDYKRKEDGKVAERICFRHNFNELMYRSNYGQIDPKNAGDCDFGVTLEIDVPDEAGWLPEMPDEFVGSNGDVTSDGSRATRSRGDGSGGGASPVTGASGAIDANGDWLMDVRGRDFARRVALQTDAYIMVVQPPRDGVTRFDRVGGDEYRAASGERYRFVSGERGIWVSADGKTVYQLRRP